MSGVRRALAWTAADRYLSLVVSLLQLVIMSRLLTPREIGIAALGLALLSIAESLRDFGATTYIIQRRDLSLDAVRTTFTLLLVSSSLLIAFLLIAAPAIARAYGEPALTTYIWVLTASFAFGPFSGPLLAMMRRDMEFGKLAAVGLSGSIVNATISIALAVLGFSYMSFAWAGLAAAALAPAVALWYRPEFSIYRLRLSDWRVAVSFGLIATATALINRFYEALPLLLLGRILSFDAVGLFQRSLQLCQLPDRFVTALVAPVAMPAFSAAARTGTSLKSVYLRSVELNSAVQWPFFLLIATLAFPLVRGLLGPQWISAAHLVQLMACANLAMVAAVFTVPVLVAAGRIQDTLWMSLISLPLSVVFLLPAAFLGVEAIAASYCLTLPLQAWVAISFIRRQVPFTWSELAQAVRSSAIVCGCTLAAPLIVVASNGAGFDMSLPVALLCGALALPGWLTGLWLTNHPLWQHSREWYLSFRSNQAGAL